MSEIEYPKYTREQNLACKLTEDNIIEIKKRHKDGETMRSLARYFNVHHQTIKMWIDDEYREHVKQYNKLYRRNHNVQQTPEYKKRAALKFKLRKKIINPEFKAWKKEADKKCPYIKTEKFRKMAVIKTLKWVSKNREKRNEYVKEWSKKKYHSNEEYRKNNIKRSVESRRKRMMDPEYRKKQNMKYAEYAKKRYHSDEEYRKKVLLRVSKRKQKINEQGEK